MLEIKCPYKFRDLTIAEMAMDKDCSLDQHLTLRKGHAYYDQVQLQMFVTGRKYADYMVWTLKDSHVCRVHPDEEWRGRVLPMLKAFWEMHVVPQLVSPPAKEESMDQSPSVHCMCGGRIPGSCELRMHF